jgi:hypothetical protein
MVGENASGATRTMQTSTPLLNHTKMTVYKKFGDGHATSEATSVATIGSVSKMIRSDR